MSTSTYRVAVTKIFNVTLDEAKMDDEFWRDFNTSIDDRGGEDFPYIAEHIAWNHVQGDTEFVEGVGDLKEMNVKVREIDSEVESEKLP